MRICPFGSLARILRQFQCRAENSRDLLYTVYFEEPFSRYSQDNRSIKNIAQRSSIPLHSLARPNTLITLSEETEPEAIKPNNNDKFD